MVAPPHPPRRRTGYSPGILRNSDRFSWSGTRASTGCGASAPGSSTLTSRGTGDRLQRHARSSVSLARRAAVLPGDLRFGYEQHGHGRLLGESQRGRLKQRDDGGLRQGLDLDLGRCAEPTSAPYPASCTTSFSSATTGTVTATDEGDSNDTTSDSTTLAFSGVASTKTSCRRVTALGRERAEHGADRARCRSQSLRVGHPDGQGHVLR